MQRITRISIDHNDSTKLALLEQYSLMLSLLKPHLTERTFSIFAIPKLMSNNDYLGWYTHLEGQPILIDHVADESHKQKIKDTLTTRINDIETAIKSIPLNDEQQKLVALWLPRIKNLANQIFVINDEPVIIFDLAKPVLSQPVIPPVTVSKSFWRWWYWLILALLLLGLLSLLWYFFYPSSPENKAQSVPELIIIPPVLVNKPEPVSKPAPVVEPPKAPQVVATPEHDPVPAIEPEPVINTQEVPKVKPKPKVKNPPNCITQDEIKNNPNPSKMVIVFDNSLSMTATLAESPAEVEQFFQYLSYGYPRNMSEQEKADYQKKMTRLPSRLSTSKGVALSSIDKIQPNIGISLVTLNRCPAANFTQFYDYAGRSILKNNITRLNPSGAGGGGTPLYSGLEKASSMLDGVNRNDYILIISDGEDSCSRNNICTLANYISTQKPKLKINIVDIAGEHKIDCVADMTGGKVYIAQSPKDMIKQMNNAVSDLKINRPVCQ
ncbi:hypothetical protein J3U57_08140 [Gilliamella sp. B3464]|uniref:vWA domain-containing protein n=1 Tax=unclassified Gilliamella TaxID=2685620 RepID=UPI00226A3243|nr:MULTISPECIES: hypothetical protein [unclassified Gilliamella]MCX8712525.1 hypothetical protein [Gilliamella sp. B3468]MCX8751538.1 hypothetical protein [Gilliamella sp. B3464]